MSNNDKMGRVSAGLIGALFGFATGSLVTYLSDSGNRDKVKQTIDDKKEDVSNKLNDLKLSLNKTNRITRKKMAKNLRNFAAQLESR